MRPTGKLHLGHLVGALENWVKLQDEYDCYFMVADWHALMSEYENTATLSDNIIDNVIDWLAAGVSPEKAVIFVQSEVPMHLELFMIASCVTPLGWLERCPTYKEQLREITTRDLNTYGFLGYPVLQAADILVYKADKVPVGEDQLPHLELTREICRKLNSLCKSPVLPEPQALLTENPRLLGLDGRKMSKSYNNTINLSDSPEEITQKVSAMFTDPKRIKLSDAGHPDICNVYSYYVTFVPEMKQEVSEWCISASIGCTECKKRLSKKIVQKLEPFYERRLNFLKNKALISDILEDGRKKAVMFASHTLKEIKQAMNIYCSIGK